jgi:hypothetical protein
MLRRCLTPRAAADPWCRPFASFRARQRSRSRYPARTLAGLRPKRSDWLTASCAPHVSSVAPHTRSKETTRHPKRTAAIVRRTRPCGRRAARVSRRCVGSHAVPLAHPRRRSHGPACGRPPSRAGRSVHRGGAGAAPAKKRRTRRSQAKAARRRRENPDPHPAARIRADPESAARATATGATASARGPARG